jgi:alpha-tubulin suppressor-like RCC1 family protein
MIAVRTRRRAAARRCSWAGVALVAAGACGGAGPAGRLAPGEGGPVIALALGGSHSCALLADETVRCWGSNRSGRLGDGTIKSRASPVRVSGLSGVKQIAPGEAHTCALVRDGTVRCWGDNEHGQCGTHQAYRLYEPAAVPDLGAVAQIAAGEDYTCVLGGDGAVRCRGGYVSARGEHPLSRCPKENRYCTETVPDVPRAIGLAARRDHFCALLADTSVRCWTFQSSLGERGLVFERSPVEWPVPSGAAEVAVGLAHACARRRDGAVRCWGANAQGQLGDGTTRDSPSPVTVSGLPPAVGLALGDFHSCALLRDRTVRCWGLDNGKQLGLGPPDRRAPASPSPREVVGLHDVAQVAAGAYHTCALRRDGGVFCWGDDSSNQCGASQAGRRDEPRDPGTPEPVRWRSETAAGPAGR